LTLVAQRVGLVWQSDSIGGTPTGTVVTIALHEKLLMIGVVTAGVQFQNFLPINLARVSYWRIGRNDRFCLASVENGLFRNLG
jgi:hypothetical protein